MPRTFYRIVRSDPPTRDDFLSHASRGLVRAGASAEARRLAEGVSVFSTIAQARNKARDLPILGSYIARLEIPDNSPAHIERTVRSNPGHHTIWGSPDTLRLYVVSVERA